MQIFLQKQTIKKTSFIPLSFYLQSIFQYLFSRIFDGQWKRWIFASQEYSEMHATAVNFECYTIGKIQSLNFYP